MNEKQRGITIYGLGGTGVNLVSNIIDIPSNAAGFPTAEYIVIDTSRSNLDEAKQANKEINTYLVPGVDGSGKNRAYGYSVVESHVDKFLLENKPKDFSIVLFSLSGGTGSILGPLLLAELSRRGLDAVGICVGSVANGKEANNTLKTLGSLQAMAVNLLEKPIVCNIHLNSNTTNRTEVDNQIESNVRALALLAAGTNLELDSTDISNWLDYTKVTDVPKQLVDLVITTSTDNDMGISAVSVASLLTAHTDDLLELNQPYGCVGYLPSSVIGASTVELHPMHFILTNSLLNDRLSFLEETVENYSKLETNIKATPVTMVDGEANGAGMIL